ncbi:DUF58 domain-containing protein [Sporosarcina sp. Te-1]|uniref:DUF58 domain-containing protein n=1 Tax=Sporosarcina sp. Te-1 TaxID=2818390 RepID=UPI001A9CC303|nr:DUF58 domain-containing protein [Sporosarcina sp. Te-1]QTD42491.1 DUF58 domain-containing protein [Sporosarcina sp. Te-1]
MTWTRYENGFKWIHNGMLITLALFLLSFIFAQPLLAACFAAVFAMLAFQNFYFSKVGKNVDFQLKDQEKRFLIGDEDELVFLFENGGVPIWNATLKLSIEDAVAPLNENQKYYSGIYDLDVPFAIGQNKRIELRIPLKGRKRGVSRITRVILEIPHLFGDGSVLMELNEPVKIESLVYPLVKKRNDNLQSAPFRPGEFVQQRSLYHDVFQPIGTRDYVPTDRFDQIHWTASARMQKLQTKQFLPVSDRTVILLLNMLERDHRTQDLEEKIERLASYADYCESHNIPYSVAVNVHTFASTPYLYIPNGIGKVQYLRTLETLARLSEKHAKLPFESMLINLESRGKLPDTIVMISHASPRLSALVTNWSKKYVVKLDAIVEKGEEERWNKERLDKTGTDSSFPNG